MTEEKKPKVIFEPGWADAMMEDGDMTEQDLQDLMQHIIDLFESGELEEHSTPVSELPEEEQEEIYNMIERSQKNVRH